MSLQSEVNLRKHLTRNLVEVSIAGKEIISPRELEADMSGKRSSQRNIELSDQCETKKSKLQTSRIAESKVSEAVSQNNPTKSIVEDFDRKIQLYSEVPDKAEEKMSLIEVDDSLSNPGKVMYSEDNPALYPVAHSLNTNYLLKSQKENNNVGRKTKKKEQCNFPCRSKQPVITLGSGKLTHQLENGASAAGDVSRSVGTRSGNIVNGASQHVGASSEADDFFDTLEDISYLSDESLNNGIMLLDDQVVSNDLHHKPDTVENSEMLSFQFREVPCFDFAYKILTGELPINYEPPCQGEPLNEFEKYHENLASTEDKPHALESENASVVNLDKEFMFPILPNTWIDSDPFIGIAFQSSIEDDLFRGYFQQNYDTIYNEVSTPAPPVFFPCDITPQFDTTGAYVPVFPENAYWPPAENVTKPLPINSSSQRAASESVSNSNGIGSD